MITLHHLENSRSIRILWLAEEIGLDYDLVKHERKKESGTASDDFKKLHKLGKAPLVIDNDQVLIESGAIMDYLINKCSNGELRPPKDTLAYYRYTYWMYAAEGSVMSLLTLVLFLNLMDTRPPFVIRPFIKAVTSKVRSSYVTPNLEKTLAYIEEELGKSKWFAGDEFSAADIMMGYDMYALRSRGGLDDNYPNCQRWIKQMEERPAFKRAMEKNGPFDIM